MLLSSLFPRSGGVRQRGVPQRGRRLPSGPMRATPPTRPHGPQNPLGGRFRLRGPDKPATLRGGYGGGGYGGGLRGGRLAGGPSASFPGQDGGGRPPMFSMPGGGLRGLPGQSASPSVSYPGQPTVTPAGGHHAVPMPGGIRPPQATRLPGFGGGIQGAALPMPQPVVTTQGLPGVDGESMSFQPATQPSLRDYVMRGIPPHIAALTLARQRGLTF